MVVTLAVTMHGTGRKTVGKRGQPRGLRIGTALMISRTVRGNLHHNIGSEHGPQSSYNGRPGEAAAGVGQTFPAMTGSHGDKEVLSVWRWVYVCGPGKFSKVMI